MAKVSKAKIKRELMLSAGDSAAMKQLAEDYMELRERYESTGDMEAYSQMLGILNALQATPGSRKRDELETALRAQLAAKHLTGSIFDDRVDTFLKLWDAFQDANRHLKQRGRTYITISSAGKEYEKDNAATKDMVSLAKAMGDILDELEITVAGYDDPDEEDDL